MSERRGRGRPPVVKDKNREEEEVDVAVVLKPPPSEMDLCRLQLRCRWELASVLNFLNVFQSIIPGELKISAEEVEVALTTADHLLAKIHISLLKGIPPVSKNLEESDVWLTVLSKKLKMWWPWVAEGEIPLVFNNGVEISTYKELDSVTRLQILKALCEIRLQQDDILSYVDEEVKRGGLLSKFRKDSIYQDGNGTTYWYDGDSIIGHRLYKNATKVEYKPKPKGRGRLTQPTLSFQWETLATNIKEFQQVTDKLLCSKVSPDRAIGTIVKEEILPAIEELEKVVSCTCKRHHHCAARLHDGDNSQSFDQSPSLEDEIKWLRVKKKERLLKRRQKQVKLFEGLTKCDFIQSRRSCRDRRPVCYTFDEYDQSIDEAIEKNTEQPILGLPEMRKRLRERPTPNMGYSNTEGDDGLTDSSLSSGN